MGCERWVSARARGEQRGVHNGVWGGSVVVFVSSGVVVVRGKEGVEWLVVVMPFGEWGTNGDVPSGTMSSMGVIMRTTAEGVELEG